MLRDRRGRSPRIRHYREPDPTGAFHCLNENLHVYNTNDIHFFKDGPSENNGVFARWRHLITTSGIIQ